MKSLLFPLLGIMLFSASAQESLPAAIGRSGGAYIRFTPSSFSNAFSLNMKPVLSIAPGDTVATETVDAGGFDKNNDRRQKGGNPLTGPFYVSGALPGDVLAVTLTKVSLNRSTAFTTEYFVTRSLPARMFSKKEKIRRVTWRLDTLTGFAMLSDSFYNRLGAFKIPLQPFLGCIGVAPSNKKNEVLSFFQGPFGGNLDYGRVTTGATIYLPVFHEGAYLYIGDGHAQQGDGEIAGNALETSMSVEFTTRLIKNESLSLQHPRVEDAEYLMAVGTGKDLDDALKIATGNMLSWLQKDYGLSLPEATQVLSTAIEYSIAEIADPKVEVIAKIKKEQLKTLQKNSR